jgi:sugar O-acyltransferase (sialic acid O-acetyltransferase NeuD family)
MRTRLVIMGATAFPEIKQIILDINSEKEKYSIVGILDDNQAIAGEVIDGAKVLGPLVLARELNDCKFIMAIGSHKSRISRFSILKRIQIPAEEYETIIHPTAVIYASARVGRGCVIYPGVVVFSSCSIGDHAFILPNSVIGVNNTIQEGALITSLVTTTANVSIGAYSHIGTGSCISENVRIGTGAQVGIGSVVLRDVPAGAFCLGNPARVIGQIDIPPDVMARFSRR